LEIFDELFALVAFLIGKKCPAVFIFLTLFYFLIPYLSSVYL
jgi:hypothetical protein